MLVVDAGELDEGRDGDSTDRPSGPGNRLTWEELPVRDWRRDLWQPAASTDLITTHPGGLPAAASTATTDATEPTDATIGTHRPYDGNAAGLGDLTADDEFASSKANYRTDAEVFPGTLVKFRTPAEFATPWGTLMVAVCGWNDLVRLTARFGFDEAWRMLEQR